MASPSVDISTGWTAAFATSSFSIQLVDLTPPPMTRETRQTSHQGTTAVHSKMPADFSDRGDLVFTGHYNPDTDAPIDSAEEQITLTSPAGATWVFQGFMTGYEPDAPLNEVMTVTVTCAVNGDITITPAA